MSSSSDFSQLELRYFLVAECGRLINATYGDVIDEMEYRMEKEGTVPLADGDWTLEVYDGQNWITHALSHTTLETCVRGWDSIKTLVKSPDNFKIINLRTGETIPCGALT